MSYQIKNAKFSFSLRVSRSRNMYSVVYVLVYILLSHVPVAQGLAQFTKVPIDVLYVSVGKTARLVWDYTVDDRQKELQECSPVWYFYGQNKKYIIGYELGFFQRKWVISNKTCPKRLLNPTRVSSEENATLVIKNVKISDSGMYGCSLMRAKVDTITSSVQLVATTQPKISMSGENTSNLNITEGEGIDINCSAIGYPTPNVTLVNMTSMRIMNEGVGNTTQRIHNITRYQHGWYECRASNNPNEAYVMFGTKIIVFFQVLTESPSVNLTNSNRPTSSPSTFITVVKQVSTEFPPSIDDRNRNGHGLKSSPASFQTAVTQAFTPVTKPSRRGRKNNTPVVIGIIGAGSLMVISIVITVAIIAQKKYNQKKKDIASNKSVNNTGRTTVVIDTIDKVQQIPVYAEVDLSKKKKNPEGMPIYAQVDKSKKKHPGEIIYAELEDPSYNKEILSVTLPPSYIASEYAEIQGLSRQEDVEPIYEQI